MQTNARMRSCLQDQLLPDLACKTMLVRQLMVGHAAPQVLNWMGRRIGLCVLRQSWNPRAERLVFDEIDKLADWKAWLKGVIDAWPEGQALLVTGSARIGTFGQ